jgi:hypothetical protein
MIESHTFAVFIQTQGSFCISIISSGIFQLNFSKSIFDILKIFLAFEL